MKYIAWWSDWAPDGAPHAPRRCQVAHSHNLAIVRQHLLAEIVAVARPGAITPSLAAVLRDRLACLLPGETITDEAWAGGGPPVFTYGIEEIPE